MGDFGEYLRGELDHLRNKTSQQRSGSERAELTDQVVARSRKRRRIMVSSISSLVILFGVAGGVAAISIGDSGSGNGPGVISPAQSESSPAPSDSTVSPTPDSSSPAPESSESPSVQVFFLREDAATPFEKSSYAYVERATGLDQSTKGHLTSALEQLVKGPLPKERDDGLTSVFTEKTAGIVNNVEVVGGKATIQFRDFTEIIPSASTSQGATTLIFQLNMTVFQFEEIEQVDYLIEGNCSRFWQFLQAECSTVTRESWDGAGIDVSS